jgi:carboxymethylenebutenolidase
MNPITTPLPNPPLYQLSCPNTPPCGGVLVLHAWWGLNNFTRAFCDRLACQGYLALAPDLYHGLVAATIPEARKLRTKLKGETVEGELLQAAARLQSQPGMERRPFGVIGFSLGAHWALWLANQAGLPLAATVVFYGTRGGDYKATRSAFLGHYAESDDFVAASGVKKLHKALAGSGRPVSFHTYPGTTHWFFESDRPDAYQPQAAELAWQRTIQFLQDHL